MTIVVDASAALSALAPGAPADDAHRALRELMSKDRLVAPSLLVWEIGNVICGSASRILGDSSVEDRSRIVLALLDGIELDHPTTVSVIATTRISRTHRLTFYDAAYLELASRDGDAFLATEDAALAGAARAVLGASRVGSLAAAHDRHAKARRD